MLHGASGVAGLFVHAVVVTLIAVFVVVNLARAAERCERRSASELGADVKVSHSGWRQVGRYQDVLAAAGVRGPATA